MICGERRARKQKKSFFKNEEDLQRQTLSRTKSSLRNTETIKAMLIVIPLE
jgi:hypothetical protein